MIEPRRVASGAGPGFLVSRLSQLLLRAWMVLRSSGSGVLSWRLAGAVGVATALPVTGGEWDHPPAEPDPLLRHERYPSEVLRLDVGVGVYLPPGYAEDPGRRYPVVYWLPEAEGDEAHPTLAPSRVEDAIRRGILPPLILITVCGGGRTWYLNTADGLKPAELTFLQELIPWVDRSYRTQAARGGRVLLGAGMGGYGAVRLALAHPERFCGGAALDGDFRTAGEFQAQRDGQEAFLRVFGGDTNRFAAAAPATLARLHADRLRGRTGLLLAVGSGSSGRAGSERLRRDLTALRFPPRWLEVSGSEGGGVVGEAGLAALEAGVGWMDDARSPASDGPWVNPPSRFLARVEHHVLYSRRLGRAVGYSLYRPEHPSGDGAPMPVVYHLHGRLEDESMHLEAMGYLDAAIGLGDVPPMAWVWPYGGRLGCFVDSDDGRVPAESILLEEVIPHVEARWRLGGGVSGRAVEGWGMGAWGALRLAGLAPARFGAVLIHNPVAPDAAGMRERYPEVWAGVFGADPAYFAARDPLAVLPRRAGELRDRLPIRMVVGQRAVVPRLDGIRLRSVLEAAGYRVDYEEVPGLGSGGPVLYPKTGLKDLGFLGRHLRRGSP